MSSQTSWAKQIEAFGNRSTYKAIDLYTAEKAAYTAYEARVAEMKYSGHGVLPHDGNNQKTILTSVISLLTLGDEKGFRNELKTFGEKAHRDPVHFSPISYGLSAADGFLRNIQNSEPRRPRRVSSAGAARHVFALLTAP